MRERKKSLCFVDTTDGGRDDLAAISTDVFSTWEPGPHSVELGPVVWGDEQRDPPCFIEQRGDTVPSAVFVHVAHSVSIIVEPAIKKKTKKKKILLRTSSKACYDFNVKVIKNIISSIIKKKSF